MPYKDPETEKAYRAAWWAKNREQQIARLRKRYHDNKEYYRKRSKEWNDAHPGWQRGRALNRRRKFPFLHLLKTAKDRAKKKNIPFTLTWRWAEEKWTGKCEITDLPFAFRSDGKSGPLARSPSIDRIIPSLGYTPDNCRFVLHCINSMKHDSTEEEMKEVIMSLLRNYLRLSL